MNLTRRGFVLFALMAAAFLGLGRTRADDVIFDGDTYAAIAYSPATGKYGYAYNFGSRASAEEAAVRNCKADDARIVTWVNNGWCALALGDDRSSWGTGWSFGDGATNTFAKQQPLGECRKRTTGCRVVLCICSLNLAPEFPSPMPEWPRD